ncbi:MAG: hypothetical protein EOM25_03160 [Deltaproteobacteria bacterium]|nr:hypothetical protein [Deltaproteobacteria bacterium]
MVFRVFMACMLAAGILTAGCAGPSRTSGIHTETQVRMDMGRLEIGLPKDNVLDLLGSPWCSETVHGTEFLVYRTGCGTVRGGKRLQLPECFTPVGVRSGRVVGWGIRYYEMSTGEDFLGCGSYKDRR